MKKTWIPIFVGAVFVSLMVALATACAGAKDGSAAVNGGAQSTATPTGSGAAAKTVYGVVSDIAGNDLTVKVVNMPDNALAFMTGGGAGSGQNRSLPTDASGNPVYPSGRVFTTDANGNRVRPSGGFSFSTDAAGNVIAPSGMDTSNLATDAEGNYILPSGRGNWGNGSGNFTRPTNSDGTFATSTPDYTGEVVDVIVPVGLSVTTYAFVPSSGTGSGSASGSSSSPAATSSGSGNRRMMGSMQETQVSLSNIQTGDTVYVTYAADGVTVASVVLVPKTGGMGAFFSGNYGGTSGGQPPVGGSDGVTIQVPDGGSGSGSGGQVIQVVPANLEPRR